MALVLLLVFTTRAAVAQSIADGAARALHPFNHQSHQRLNIEVGTESVGDTVEYEPHLDGGGFAESKRRIRYTGAYLGLHWSPSPALDVFSSVWTRDLISKRDVYSLYSVTIGARYRLGTMADRWHLSATASVGSNRAAALEKNSYTHYSRRLVTSARLESPEDWRAQAGLLLSSDLTPQTRLSGYAGVGLAVSDYDAFHGKLTDTDGCKYYFGVSASAGYVQLADPCDNVNSMRQDFPSADAFKAEYGFDGDADIRNDVRFAHAGVQAIIERGRFEFGFGYHYQTFARGAMANRLRARGIAPILSNQSASTWLQYQLTGRFALHAGLEYSMHPMLNRLTLLYTSFTSERFEQDALSFSLGLRFAFQPPR